MTLPTLVRTLRLLPISAVVTSPTLLLAQSGTAAHHAFKMVNTDFESGRMNGWSGWRTRGAVISDKARAGPFQPLHGEYGFANAAKNIYCHIDKNYRNEDMGTFTSQSKQP